MLAVFGGRRGRLPTYAVLVFGIVGSLLMIWMSPAAVSAVWSLKTLPFKQPDLDIPGDTSTVKVAVVIPKTRHEDIRWINGLDSS